MCWVSHHKCVKPVLSSDRVDFLLARNPSILRLSNTLGQKQQMQGLPNDKQVTSKSSDWWVDVA